MRSIKSKSFLNRTGLAASLLLLASGAAFGQQAVNLAAGPATATLPDGTAVPMWGYSCGAAVTGSTATCAALNKSATSPAVWSPVVITVPTGQDLQINLTNNLSFTPATCATPPCAPNNIPTSIVIVGQLGGGLGQVSTGAGTPGATYTASPAHAAQGTTWPVAGTPGGGNATFTPPAQGPRVQSFATEVPAGAGTASTASLTWTAPNPGTYLIESGTHPSIQGPMGLYGILVVTAAPTASGGTETAAGTAYPGVTYDADVPLLLSEIDPLQNGAVSAAVNTAGFSETAVWSGQPNHCGNPTSANYHTCYPPAVNYTPLYYLVNGVAFDKTNASASLFPVNPATLAPAAGTSGKILVRLVNAGLRMHVPSIVGSTAAGPTASGATSPPGFALIAQDGNPLPGLPRVQSEVFMAAGKTYDVMINAPAAVAPATVPPALGIYDRALALSGNATERDAGMLAYIGANGAALPASGALATATARPDTYNGMIAGQPLSVSDPSLGVIANDTNVYGVAVSTPPTGGTLSLNTNGTFTYVPNAGTTSDSFTYCANGTTAGTTGAVCASVTLGAAKVEAAAGITVASTSYTSTMATSLSIDSPGVLGVDSDAAGYPLSVAANSVVASQGLSLVVDPDGGFHASVSSPGQYSFTYKAQNSQGTVSANAATVTLNFPTPSNLQVNVVDGQDKTTQITDYRWVIEEDRTFYVDPGCTTNPPPAKSTVTGQPCANASTGVLPTFGTNFHTSHMNFVAQGCTGTQSCESGQTLLGQPAVCDVGDGACRTTATQETPVLPSQVALDPTKRYYISILPGDAANPFAGGYTGSPCAASATGSSCVGHGMGGAEIAAGQSNVTVISEPSPYQPGKLSVFVFEDDFPLNGENDAGGGVDVLAPNEPGLGGFNIELWDMMAGYGDFTGQMTYDMFNQPLSNSLAGTVDPVSGFNACPISKQDSTAGQAGITGMIVTCPKYESDGKTLSPLAGQAIIANLMPGLFGVIATPGADRIGKGEEWLQTNTLDGQKAHDSFVRIGEPSYFQEYGPANYHVTIGFANPAIINGRHAGVCAGTDVNLQGTNCTNTLVGKITTERMSRTPDERLYSSGSHDSFYWTQCYVSLGDPDGEDFAFTKCNPDGTFTLTGLPDGTWRITVFDQWNDMLVDGLSTPVALSAGNDKNCTGGSQSAANICDIGDIATNQWQSNIYTRTFIDDNQDGVSQSDESGIPLIPVSVRYRDGSLANTLSTDFTGTANFNETFPLFNWYVVESDTTRYKNTGTHVVYDSGGPADGTPACTQPGYPPCGNSVIGKFMANTAEVNSLPVDLRLPGAVYCAGADCTGKSIENGSASSDPPSVCSYSNPNNAPSGGAVTCSTILSTGRIDPPSLGGSEGWQGFPGQNNWVEFGKEPYAPGENGGIKGHVVYASTRPFDDPSLLVQTQWEPLVPHVTINLYQEGTGPDGRQTLKLVDTTQTSSWDDWAQGFHVNSTGETVPNMSCPGQSATNDLFFFTLKNQPNYLDLYNSEHGGPAPTPLPDNSQFKCYDGMHNWNQVQPAPYDGMYAFPSITSLDPATGKPNGTNCKICTPDHAVPATDLYYGLPMLPEGKYVVEVVVPPGYELVKEEDKNILIGDDFIAPVTQEIGALGNIFILPDQASIGSQYNANNAQNPTNSFGSQPRNGIVPGFVPEPNWPCVGEERVVPDYISLFPQTQQVAPFAGATRPLCDRKEVTLGDQRSAIAKFYIFTSTHVAAKFAGVITDDFTSEFDPFSPAFGEKFSPPNMPIAFRDYTGNEISRVYSDQWGAFNGMTYSSWEVNPPNPTGYSPTMMVTCMNDPGPIPGPNGTMITDPLFNPDYSQFCYEIPFMPGQTQYMDTPVVPTAAFTGSGYNNVDCAYPDATPAVKEVDGDGVGPWVSAPGNALKITALGDQPVNNYGYSGPSATKAPFNQKTVTRHYGFGATPGVVTIGGVSAPITSWTDAEIDVTVPTGVKKCAMQQQAQYGGSTAYCGELRITAANGQKSIDAVTVTIGGKAPTVLTASDPMTPSGPGAIQRAIDAAEPGDLIIVPPGTYNEMLLMWKPVRLQGVGAASSIINANTQPAGKLDPWRHEVNCLFGLALNGTPMKAGNPYDATGAVKCAQEGAVPGVTAFSGKTQNPQVDRLPLEGIIGWDTTTNGNLAQMLQEPTLMGAYEGAGITVLAKGVNTHGATGYYGSGAEAAFPTGTTLLTENDCEAGKNDVNPYPSNFQCNPSSIDGLAITDSSQGGGGIFVHAWAHNLQIANDRIYNNIGTLAGGINVGQGESPDGYFAGTVTDSDPGSCVSGAHVNTQLPYCFDMHLNVHNNYITLNQSIGDELFSGTPAGAGGASFCTGADYYKFRYNWVCGNMSTGDGGGVSHLGFIYKGTIAHNYILFNMSSNPTIATNGGGLIIEGAAPDGFTAAGLECGSVVDIDCPPGLPDGTGPGLRINANLIMGNTAESGSGGGLRLQSVNGPEVSVFPKDPDRWYRVSVTNNIIANNVAGWDGGGVSLQDALAVNLVNNTIVSNDTTASAGVLFNTLGAPLASAPGATNQTTSATTSAPQPAGLVTMPDSGNLSATFKGLTLQCPDNHPNCAQVSTPYMTNDIFWQNRTYYIGIGSLDAQYQQNIVALFNSAFSPSGTPTTGATPFNQTATGSCPAGSAYWDIGVRGDTGPGNHASGFSLRTAYSVLTNASENVGGTASNDLVANPALVTQYCNGARTPPEAGGVAGWQVPPGISDATVPNPIFNLTPNATVDEGNNWVNMSWGPLSLFNPATGATLGNYGINANSPVIDKIPLKSDAGEAAPRRDYFGNRRPDPATANEKKEAAIDIGAVEFQTGTATPPAMVQ